MNLTEIRARVRDILYMATDEFPNTLVDMFAEDAFRRIIATDRRWPFYQDSVTLSATAGVGNYTLTAGLSSELEEVSYITEVDATGRLNAIAYQDGLERFGLADQGTPTAWSVWGGRVYLWPVPDAAHTLTVVGYRPHTDWWTDIGAEIDCDEAFHMPILYFVLSRAYAQMEDTEMADWYEQQFISGAASASKIVMKRNSADYPLIMSGDAVPASTYASDRVLIEN